MDDDATPQGAFHERKTRCPSDRPDSLPITGTWHQPDCQWFAEREFRIFLMFRLFVCLLIVICSGCAKDHAWPPANLSYVSVERDRSLYVIRYQSNVDVLDLFGRGERVGMASGMLHCALAEDQDFSVGKAIRFSVFGLISPDKRDGAPAGYSYLTHAFISETSSDRSSERYLSVAEINHLLSGKQQIPCKVVVTAYGYKPYYSNTMNLPVADLLREVNKP